MSDRPESAKGTVTRVLSLLKYVAETKGEFGIKDVAPALGLAPSSAHRLLAMLIEDDFVARSESRRYRIGPQFLRLAGMALEGNDLAAAALAPMQRLAEQCGETCLLALYHKHSATMSFVLRVDSLKSLRYRIRMNAIETLLWGATGRSILAFLPPESIQAVVARGERSPGDGKKLELAELKADLAMIRTKGYAFSKGQRIEGAVGISAPVFDGRAEVIGSLSVTLPAIRFQARDEGKIASMLLHEAAALSGSLGFQGGGA
jgi:DNA-binding IclR family transcriptional regulator